MVGADKPTMVDLEQAIADPGSIFATPEMLVLRDDLSREQEIEILRRWKYDASKKYVAVEEGMPDGETDLLRRILLALDQLGDGIDVEHVGPTKEHGIPRSGLKSE